MNGKTLAFFFEDSRVSFLFLLTLKTRYFSIVVNSVAVVAKKRLKTFFLKCFKFKIYFMVHLNNYFRFPSFIYTYLAENLVIFPDTV
jgi:hypothetical protein